MHIFSQLCTFQVWNLCWLVHYLSVYEFICENFLKIINAWNVFFYFSNSPRQEVAKPTHSEIRAGGYCGGDVRVCAAAPMGVLNARARTSHHLHTACLRPFKVFHWSKRDKTHKHVGSKKSKGKVI